MSQSSSCIVKLDEYNKISSRLDEMKKELEVLRKFGIQHKLNVENEMFWKQTTINSLEHDQFKHKIYLESFCPKLNAYLSWFKR